MTEPPRLKTTSNHAACRLLLESALEDHSAPGAAERALLALSAGAGAATLSGAAHASGASSAGSHIASSIVMKWLGLGILGGAATLFSADQAVRRFSGVPATQPAATTLGAKAAARQTHHDAVAAREPRVANSETASFAAPAERSADGFGGGGSVEPPRPSARPSKPVEDPVQDLRAIRSALAAHSAERALTLLDAFVVRYPSSTLLEEAAVLRFDALLALGSGEARAAGAGFLRRYPRSAYAERVRLKLLALP
jgi:hypothetical protein